MGLLEWDADYGRYSENLRQSAASTFKFEDFKFEYDVVISNMIDTFRGQHTDFMWEDDTFLPWLRQVLTQA